MSTQKKRVVILGGGMAALTTAWELTREPGWRDELEIDVYQLGFRLGGKGASGRDMERGARIEEHGLHILFGFYENAFRLLRECYAELGRPAGAPLATFSEAFARCNTVVFPETIGGKHRPWVWDFVPNDGVAGAGVEPPSPWGYVYLMLRRAAETAPRWAGPSRVRPGKEPREPSLPPLIARLVRREGRRGFLAMLPRLLDALGRDVQALPEGPDRKNPAHMQKVARLSRWLGWLRSGVQWIWQRSDPPTPLRRAYILVDFLTTMLLGMIADGLVHSPADWFSLDGESFKGWLARHGALPATSGSALVEGMYAGIFSGAGVEVGAGTMLQYSLRMLFTYQGAILYRMQAGMGDVIFAPLYQVLARRGVRFHFFHRTDRLERSADGARVERIHMGRQVRTLGEYDPLVDVDGLPCWPNAPRYDRIEGGCELRASGENLEDFWTRWQDRGEPLVLEAGRDYDTVVLGISLGALPHVARELIEDEARPALGRAVRTIATTQTQAVQLWFGPGLEKLGWKIDPPIVIPHERPFDTWADMTHLLQRERHPAGAVGHIAYLCGALADDEPPPGREDHGYPARQKARAHANAMAWLGRSAGVLWPGVASAGDPRALDFAHLFDPEERKGHARFLAQYVATPLNPSDRYVLSVPGSVHARPTAGGSGYDNLVLTGDWILNPISAGCVEGTVMSGMLAAEAVSGRGRRILGDWMRPLERAPAQARERGGARPLAYIPHDIEDAPAPPYLVTGTTMYTFALRARVEALAALCDRTLNLGGRKRYRPLGPIVLFYCQDNQGILAHRATVAVPERDFGFMVPLVEEKSGRVVHFIPYLWVDSDLAVRGGREVHGFPKAMGRLTMPDAPGDSGRFLLEVPRVQASEPGARGKWVMVPIVEVEPCGPGGAGKAWRDMASAAGSLAGLLRHAVRGGDDASALAIMQRAAADASRGVVPMVFLKQVRHPSDASRASYQAIVEAPARLCGGLRGGGLLSGSYEIRFHGEDGARLVDKLGLELDAGDRKARPLSPFWLGFDYVMEGGEVVFEA